MKVIDLISRNEAAQIVWEKYFLIDKQTEWKFWEDAIWSSHSPIQRQTLKLLYNAAIYLNTF